MEWWAIVLIVIAGLAFSYLALGFLLTWIFLRGKMRGEKKIHALEIESNVPEEVFSYPFEEKYLINKRGLKMFARVYKVKEPTTKWVLLLHGFSSNGISMMKYGKLFNELGYNALSFDFCHCGRSEGKYLSFGWFESQDAEEWLNLIKDEYKPTQLGVFGVSMGAATAVHLCAERTDVDFLIPYCPYESYKRIVLSKGKEFTHLPFFDVFWPIVKASTYIVAGKTPADELHVGRDLAKVTCPTLLMHSKKDQFTNYHNSIDLYKANESKGNIRLHLFEKGLHARAFATDPVEYTRVVKEFLDEVNSGGSDKGTAEGE